jgi:alpha-beta hydrolase superfamily lysophospholipase
MNHFEMRWRLEDGVELYAQGWQPDAEPKAVVCLVHGLNEHSSRYAHVAAALNQAGYAVLAFDHHGHGLSGGLRGHIPSSSIYLESLDCLLQEAAQRYAGKPRFLYGHSLGGILVLYYTLSRKPVLAGVIAASAGLRTALEEQKFKIMLTKWLSPILPKLSIPTGLDPNQLSRDPEVVKAYIKDPLVEKHATLGLARSTLKAIQYTFEHAHEFHLPLLLMHGDHDQIAYPRGSQEFASLVHSSCTLKLWEGLYHETHNEPEKDQVLAYVISWLDDQMERQNRD